MKCLKQNNIRLSKNNESINCINSSCYKAENFNNNKINDIIFKNNNNLTTKTSILIKRKNFKDDDSFTHKNNLTKTSESFVNNNSKITTDNSTNNTELNKCNSSIEKISNSDLLKSNSSNDYYSSEDLSNKHTNNKKSYLNSPNEFSTKSLIFDKNASLNIENLNNNSLESNYHLLILEQLIQDSLDCKVKINSLSEWLNSNICTKKGSLLLQKLMRKHSKEIFVCFYQIIKDKYLSYLATPYANYVCQFLFFILPSSLRLSIISTIFTNKNYEELSKNNLGQSSIIYILENNLSLQEKNLVVSLIKDNLNAFICLDSLIRITECIVGSFENDIVFDLIKLIAFNLDKLSKTQEGYFLLRVTMKAVKNTTLQNIIIEELEKNFINYVKVFNGSLIVQCIIHNFNNYNFKYNKSCTKQHESINNHDISSSKEFCNNKEENKKNKDNLNNHKIIKNNALNNLMKLIVINSKLWFENHFKPILDCAIKSSTILFENCLYEFLLYNKGKAKKLFGNIVKMDISENFFKLLINNLKTKTNYLILNIVKDSLNDYKENNVCENYDKIIKFIENHINNKNVFTTNKDCVKKNKNLNKKSNKINNSEIDYKDSFNNQKSFYKNQVPSYLFNPNHYNNNNSSKISQNNISNNDFNIYNAYQYNMLINNLNNNQPPLYILNPYYANLFNNSNHLSTENNNSNDIINNIKLNNQLLEKEVNNEKDKYKAKKDFVFLNIYDNNEYNNSNNKANEGFNRSGCFEKHIKDQAIQIKKSSNFINSN